MNDKKITTIHTVLEYPMQGPLSQSGMVTAPWVESFTSLDDAKETIQSTIRSILAHKKDTIALLELAKTGLMWFDADDDADITKPETHKVIYCLSPVTRMAYVVTETELHAPKPKLRAVK